MIVVRKKELYLRAYVPHAFFGLIASTSLLSTSASAQGGTEQPNFSDFGENAVR